MLSGDDKIDRIVHIDSKGSEYVYKDDLAILEDSKSAIFKKHIKYETKLFETLTDQLEDEIETWEDDYEKMTTYSYPIHPSYAQTIYNINIKDIKYTIYIQSSINNLSNNIWIVCKVGHSQKIIWSKYDIKFFKHSVVDIDKSGIELYFGFIVDSTSGGEKDMLSINKINGMKISELYNIKDVGDSFGFIDNNIIYLKNNDDDLKYDDCICANLFDGKTIKKIYSEKDEKYQLSIETGLNASEVFLRRSNWLYQNVGLVSSNKVDWIDFKIDGKDYIGSIFILSSDCFVLNENLYYKGTYYKLPNKEYGYGGMHYKNEEKDILFIVTIKHGRNNLYMVDIKSLDKKIEYIEIFRKNDVNNSIILLEDSDIVGNRKIKFLLKVPNSSDSICSYDIDSNKLSVILKYPEVLGVKLVKASFVGKIPYYVVKGVGSGVKKPRGLIVSCYGAYGVNGNCGYPIRWLPWLKMGYYLCIGMVRGGRENGDDWWANGSTALQKINTFNDCALVIQEAQKISGMGPNHTILHGRSAGGWNATYVGQKFHYLVSAVYAEVPYVDVLRTTTNPDLPLTKLEYDEFGDPLHKPEDFKALMKISPMNNIPSAFDGLDVPFVLCRTGFYDRQVAPYEILKYAVRLREKGWHCAVGFDKKSGHFAKMSDLYKQRAEDGAILDCIVGKIECATRIMHAKHKKESSSHTVKRPRLTSSL